MFTIVPIVVSFLKKCVLHEMAYIFQCEHSDEHHHSGTEIETFWEIQISFRTTRTRRTYNAQTIGWDTEEEREADPEKRHL